MEWTYKGGRVVVDVDDPSALTLGCDPVLAYPAQYRVDGQVIPFTVYTGGADGMSSLVTAAERRVDVGLLAHA